MRRRLFTDHDVNPTDTLLRKQIGSAIAYYMTILDVSGDFRKQWLFSKGNGWLLKVDDTRKALYYLIACEDGIIISLTVRDAEMESFLRNEGLMNIRTELKNATKYSDGYAIRFDIMSTEESKYVANFLIVLIKERMSKQAPAQKVLNTRVKHIMKQPLDLRNINKN